MKDFLPRNPQALTRWMAQFVEYLEANHERLGIAEAEMDALSATSAEMAQAHQEQVAAVRMAMTKTRHRNETQAKLAALVRPVVRRIQASSATSNGDRARLGITIPGTYTPFAGDLRTSKPVARLNINNTLQHSITIRMEAPPGEKRFKPAGTLGCEIYRKVGDKPAGPSDMHLVMIACKANVILKYPGEDAGKPVHYLMRYVDRTGNHGPWSALRSSIIAA